MATTFSCALTLLLLFPSVARAHSGRDLAVYLNAQHTLPSTVYVFDERIGSAVFYLRPLRRHQLRRDQIAGVDLGELRLASQWVADDDVVAVRRSQLPRVARALNVADAAAVPAGTYVVFQARQLLQLPAPP